MQRGYWVAAQMRFQHIVRDYFGRRMAESAGVADRIEWVVGDYLGWSSGEEFDHVLSMGCLEYVVDPRPHLARMLGQCRGTAWVSFAKRWDMRVPFRLARMVAE